MDELVERLSRGDHPVEASVVPRTTQGLKECLDRGYVHVKFTGTRGGTALGVALDAAGTDLSTADFTTQKGRIRIVGGLTLNYEKVRCIADIDVETLEGHGHLEAVAG